MGPKASASQRKLRRETSVWSELDSFTSPISHLSNPYFTLSSYWQQLPRFRWVARHTHAGKQNVPHILVLNPSMPTDTRVDHLSCFCTSLRTHKQHRGAGTEVGPTGAWPIIAFHTAAPKRGISHKQQLRTPLKRDRSRAASLPQPSIMHTAKRVLRQTHPQHQLPLGGCYLLQEVAEQIHTPPFSLPSTEIRDTCKNRTSQPASMCDTCQVR